MPKEWVGLGIEVAVYMLGRGKLVASFKSMRNNFSWEYKKDGGCSWEI